MANLLDLPQFSYSALPQNFRQMLLSQKNRSFFAIILGSLFLFSACQRDAIADLETPVEPELRIFSEVDERLWPYFERFEKEGQARGLDIDLVASRISGVIEDLDGEHIAGQCTTFGSFRPGKITMDSEFWEASNDLFKEFIIFHELGHCYLDRDHREDAHSNGRCASIMRSGTLDCRDNYNGATRASYINELFEPNSLDLN